jgi:hypothetical protein
MGLRAHLEGQQKIGKGEDQERLEDQECLAGLNNLKSQLFRAVLAPEGSGDRLFAH